MIALRGTNLSLNLINGAVFGNISTNSELMYGQTGRVVMMILGSGKLSNESYPQNLRCFGKNSLWMTFIKKLNGNIVSDVVLESETRNVDVAIKEEFLVCKFHEALEDTYFSDWISKQDYISPSCFLYLLERLLFMVSQFQGYFFTTKASFVEWLIFQEWANKPTANSVNDTKSSLDMGDIHNFMANVVLDLLLNKSDTIEWIKSTENNLEDYYPLFVLRLIVVLCLLCVNFGKHFDKLFTLLDRSGTSSQLPWAFCDAIRMRECHFVDALADALKKIENPLIIVGVGEKFSCTDAFFVNLNEKKCREGIVRELFPEEGIMNHSPASVFGEKDSSYPFSKHSYGPLWKMFEALDLENEKGSNVMSIISNSPKIKVEVQKNFQLISAAMDSFPNNIGVHDGNLLAEANSMLKDLEQLSFALDMSKRELEDDFSMVSELLKRLKLRRPRLEPLLNRLLQKDTNTIGEALKNSIASKLRKKENVTMGEPRAARVNSRIKEDRQPGK